MVDSFCVYDSDKTQNLSLINPKLSTVQRHYAGMPLSQRKSRTLTIIRTYVSKINASFFYLLRIIKKARKINFPITRCMQQMYANNIQKYLITD